VQPVAPQITHDTWPTVVDAPLTLIFMMGHGGYCNLFCLYRQPKIPLWLNTPYWRCHFTGCMTKNRWRSVDAHFHDGAWRVLQSLCPERQPKIPLWLNTAYRRCHFLTRMTKNCWRSVDAHFHDGAGRALLSVFPIEAAKNSFMTDYNLSEVWFPRTHDQKSLTLRWHSFSW